MTANNTPPSVQADDEQPLELQTAKIFWSDLQRFFAKGDVIWIAPKLDLIEIAYAFKKDDTQSIKSLMEQQKVCKMKVELAKDWFEQNKEVWAVVVVPWVLVQDKK